MRNADFPHKAREKWPTDLNTKLQEDCLQMSHVISKTYTNAPYPQN